RCAVVVAFAVALDGHRQCRPDLVLKLSRQQEFHDLLPVGTFGHGKEADSTEIDAKNRNIAETVCEVHHQAVTTQCDQGIGRFTGFELRLADDGPAALLKPSGQLWSKRQRFGLVCGRDDGNPLWWGMHRYSPAIRYTRSRTFSPGHFPQYRTVPVAQPL